VKTDRQTQVDKHDIHNIHKLFNHSSYTNFVPISSDPPTEIKTFKNLRLFMLTISMNVCTAQQLRPIRRIRYSIISSQSLSPFNLSKSGLQRGRPTRTEHTTHVYGPRSRALTNPSSWSVFMGREHGCHFRHTWSRLKDIQENAKKMQIAIFGLNKNGF